MLRTSRCQSLPLGKLFKKYRKVLAGAAGGAVLILVLAVLVTTVLWKPQDAAVPVLLPASVEPLDMMGLIVAESEGIPLEAAGAACLVQDQWMEKAPEAFSQPGLSVKEYLSTGFSGKDFEKAQDYAESLSWIAQIARDKCFPFTEDVNYGYSDGWGMGRSDNRKHEGIDIFADHGTPIVSVCDGVVEKKGWLNLGGWRLGIRGEDNVYYYYAHMSEYADLEVGDTVKKGQVIGYVGDTGYGPEGTTGQFVAHLHFGMYQGKDDTEKAFSPYPFLALWDPKETPKMEDIGNPDVY